MSKLSELIAEFNKGEVLQMGRLEAIYRELCARPGYKHARFSCGEMWSNLPKDPAAIETRWAQEQKGLGRTITDAEYSEVK